MKPTANSHKYPKFSYTEKSFHKYWANSELYKFEVLAPCGRHANEVICPCVLSTFSSLSLGLTYPVASQSNWMLSGRYRWGSSNSSNTGSETENIRDGYPLHSIDLSNVWEQLSHLLWIRPYLLWMRIFYKNGFILMISVTATNRNFVQRSFKCGQKFGIRDKIIDIYI